MAALRASAAATLPRVSEAGVDGRVLAFALAVSLATGLLFGLAPALRLSRSFGPAEVLRGAGRGAVGGGARDRLRPALVVAEVALSFVLLVGAGLLLRSFDRLLAVDKGFASERVLTFTINLPSARYPEAPQRLAFFRRLLEGVRGVPGVRDASLVSDLPLAGGTNGGVGIPGRAFPPGAEPIANKRIVGADFFTVLGIPVAAGRAFTAADGPGAPQVALVNQAFARRHFPNESPVGKRIDFGWETTGTQEIVGVVADIREGALDAPPEPTVYVPLGQRSNGESSAYVVVRTRGEPMQTLGALRAAVYAVDRDQPIDRVRTLDDVVAEQLAGKRLALSLLGGFSALALLLAAVGLYAVVSHAVSQRVQEIGVRMALGAESGTVLRLVLRRSGALVGAGVAAGAVAALGATRLLAGMLYGVGRTDPLTFVGVAVVLGGAAVAASLVPALRASRVDPVRALREG
jgi:putative ABC transport system permease protein